MADTFRRVPVLLGRQTDIGMILRSDREAMDISCLQLDFELGTQDGYIQKCEHGGRIGGRHPQKRYPIAINEIGFCWMQYLGRSLVMMDTSDALKISELLPVHDLGNRRFERVKVFAAL